MEQHQPDDGSMTDPGQLERNRKLVLTQEIPELGQTNITRIIGVHNATYEVATTTMGTHELLLDEEQFLSQKRTDGPETIPEQEAQVIKLLNQHNVGQQINPAE